MGCQWHPAGADERAPKEHAVAGRSRPQVGRRQTGGHTPGAVQGEVVALLDSREIADTKSEYLAARLSAAPGVDYGVFGGPFTSL